MELKDKLEILIKRNGYKKDRFCGSHFHNLQGACKLYKRCKDPESKDAVGYGGTARRQRRTADG